jgi:hypothetical protein
VAPLRFASLPRQRRLARSSLARRAWRAKRLVSNDFLCYFKENEERIARIGEGLPADAQRLVFLGTVRRVARVYTTFAGLLSRFRETQRYGLEPAHSGTTFGTSSGTLDADTRKPRRLRGF